MKIDARTIDTGAHAYIQPCGVATFLSRMCRPIIGVARQQSLVAVFVSRGGATCTGFTDPISGTFACSSFAILSSKAPKSFDNWQLSG